MTASKRILSWADWSFSQQRILFTFIFHFHFPTKKQSQDNVTVSPTPCWYRWTKEQDSGPQSGLVTDNGI